MVPYSAQFMKMLGIQATFGKSLKDVCYISRFYTEDELNRRRA